MSNLANGRVILKFYKSVLVQKNSSSLFSNLILNLYLFYELNSWPRTPTNNFTLKKCLLGTVKLVKNTIKGKYTYNGRGKAFDGKGLWSFGNDFPGNVVIFGIDNSSSSDTNLNNKFLVLGERPTMVLMTELGQQKKNLVLTLVKQKQNFA